MNPKRLVAPSLSAFCNYLQVSSDLLLATFTCLANFVCSEAFNSRDFFSKPRPPCRFFSHSTNPSKNGYLETQSPLLRCCRNSKSWEILESQHQFRNATFNSIRLPFLNRRRGARRYGWEETLQQEHPHVVDRFSFNKKKKTFYVLPIDGATRQNRIFQP